jgi:hypothetical protein
MRVHGLEGGSRGSPVGDDHGSGLRLGHERCLSASTSASPTSDPD